MKVMLGVSQNTINRLPKYLRCLQELAEDGRTRVSSAGIAERLGLTSSQVRQDLSRFGSYGSQGYGYDVETLMRSIREILGIDRTHKVIVVGVGSIGRTLMKHLDFEGNNYELVAGFDTNPMLIGTQVHDTPIYSAEELNAFLAETQVDLCVLAVPQADAKRVALHLAKNGIPAIWNLTNVDLELDLFPVVVENVHFLDSLFSLTFQLEAMQSAMARTARRAQ